MIDVMARDEKVFAVTAAMPDGTGLDKVMARYPSRALDTGICESHAMAMCAGMAKAGLKPFFAVYSTFSQRALDQVFQEVALQGLPVRVCMDRAGLVGGDGAVHHGFLDVAMFRPFPGTALLAASDEPNLIAGLEFMRHYDAGASFIRYPRDAVAPNPLQKAVPDFELGRANLVLPSRGPRPDLAILAYGAEVYEAARAIADLQPLGYDLSLYDARFAKPVDANLIEELLEARVKILTIEDHALACGFGSAVLEACSERHIPTELIYRLGLPMRWIYQNSRATQLAEAGLDAVGIGRAVRQLVDGRVPKKDGAVVIPAGAATVPLRRAPQP